MKTPEERRRAMQIFQYFIKEFREKIDTPELEIRDLAMGIRGYGIFANVSSIICNPSLAPLNFSRLVNSMERMKMSNSCSLV